VSPLGRVAMRGLIKYGFRVKQSVEIWQHKITRPLTVISIITNKMDFTRSTQGLESNFSWIQIITI